LPCQNANSLFSKKIPDRRQSQYTEYLNNWEAENFTKNFLKDFLSENEKADFISYEEFEKLSATNWIPLKKLTAGNESEFIIRRVPVRYNQQAVELYVAVRRVTEKENNNE
jgi:hypothetical protein